MSKADDRSARTTALQEARAASQLGRRRTVVAAVVAVVLVVVGVGYWVQSTRDTTGDAPSATPSGVTDGYSIVVGPADAATTITVYEDLQCPVCQAFEQATGEQVNGGVASGDVRVEYRLVSFLDGASSNAYSSRALNALLVTLDTTGVEAFKQLHDALYADQPAEGSAGPDDEALIQAAVTAGADEAAVSGPIRDKAYEQWITNATDAMSTNGVTGTPTVFVDGERVQGTTQDAIDAVLAAVG